MQKHTQNTAGHFKNFKLLSKYNEIYLTSEQWTYVTKCMSVWLPNMEAKSKVRVPLRRPVSGNRAWDEVRFNKENGVGCRQQGGKGKCPRQ